MAEFNTEDFLALTQATTLEETERLARKVFNAVDSNGSGSIEKDECKKMLGLLMGDVPEDVLEENVANAMSDMDANKDGKVTWEEFFAFAKIQNKC